MEKTVVLRANNELLTTGYKTGTTNGISVKLHRMKLAVALPIYLKE
jgi:hypothetical protein